MRCEWKIRFEAVGKVEKHEKAWKSEGKVRKSRIHRKRCLYVKCRETTCEICENAFAVCKNMVWLCEMPRPGGMLTCYQAINQSIIPRHKLHKDISCRCI